MQTSHCLIADGYKIRREREKRKRKRRRKKRKECKKVKKDTWAHIRNSAGEMQNIGSPPRVSRSTTNRSEGRPLNNKTAKEAIKASRIAARITKVQTLASCFSSVILLVLPISALQSTQYPKPPEVDSAKARRGKKENATLKHAGVERDIQTLHAFAMQSAKASTCGLSRYTR